MVNAQGHFGNATQQATEYFARFISHDGLTGLWGLNANGNLGILPSNNQGTFSDTDQDAPSSCSSKPNTNGCVGDGDGDADDSSSAGVNQGALGCGGLITGQGFVNIYGRSTAGTQNCTGQPSGSNPLNPQNPSRTCPPPLQTLPPTPCLPAYNSQNFYTNPTPDTTYGPNCVTGGVFSGSISPGIYICNGPITISANLTINEASCSQPTAPTCPNGGVAEIFVFIPSPGGGTVVTFQSGGPINSGGPDSNLVINVSDPSLCGPSNGTVQGGGQIYFQGHGSNIAGPIYAELYAPNDSINQNGAPFSTWYGNLLVCWANFNGGGNAKATIYDNIYYYEIVTPWYSFGYKD